MCAFYNPGDDILSTDVTETSSGSGDSGKGVKLNSDGKLDRSLLKGKKFTAGGAISAGAPVRITVADDEDDDGTTVTTEYPINGSGALTRKGERYTPASDIYVNYVQIYMRKVGSPGTLTINLRSGSITGTVLATATVAEGDIPTTAAYYQVDFDSIVKLDGSTDYYLEVFPATADGSNYVSLYSGGTSGGGGTKAWEYTGSWSGFGLPDYATKYGVDDGGTAGEIKEASAATQTEADLFIGFAQAAISDTNDGFVDIHESSENQSGLTIGSIYYLSDTPGSISTTPGTNTVRVGIAVSATELVILIERDNSLL